MSSRFMLTLTDAQEQSLLILSRSPRRDESDRARAILWSAAGTSSADIAAVLGVRAEQVRRWRSRFREGDTEGLQTRKQTGRPATKAETALSVVVAVLTETPLEARWTCARLAREVARRTGVTISINHLAVVLRKKGAIGDDAPGTR